MEYIITTPRLGLRDWQKSDIQPMTELNLDPRVMEFFPSIPTPEQTLSFIKGMKVAYKEKGYCYFAADRLDTGQFIGFIGLMYQDYESPFTPHTDIGWRLAVDAWGNGFATEGAQACLDFAFRKLDLQEIRSVCPLQNFRSENVMKKIGMSKIGEFDHPKIPDHSPLKTCVVYQIKG